MRSTDSASEETVSKESTIDFLLVSRADSVSQSEWCRCMLRLFKIGHGR